MSLGAGTPDSKHRAGNHIGVTLGARGKPLIFARRREDSAKIPEGRMPMSPEERQLLTGLFDRIRGAASTPRDQEAEALIQDATKAQPYAPYFLAQTVLVQDQALRAANDRLQELEGKVKDLEAQAASGPRPGGFLSGLGSLFGGSSGPSSAPRAPAPPPPGRLRQQPAQGRGPP